MRALPDGGPARLSALRRNRGGHPLPRRRPRRGARRGSRRRSCGLSAAGRTRSGPYTRSPSTHPARRDRRCVTLARMAATLTLADVDLLDHDLFAEQRAVGRLRAAAARGACLPPSRSRAAPGFWCVTRYDDVLTCSATRQTFSSELGGAATIDDLPEDVLAARRNFMETDPPRHTQFRRIFAADFTPRAVRRYERRGCASSSRSAGRSPRARASSRRCTRSRRRSRSACSPASWACATSTCRAWSSSATGCSSTPSPSTSASSRSQGERRRGPLPAVREPLGGGALRARARVLRRPPREHPRDDVLSLIANGRARRLPALRPRSRQHVRDPRRRRQRDDTSGDRLGSARVRAQPRAVASCCATSRELVPSAVEEVLRYAHPVWHFRRTATRDTELRGVPIAAGDKVVVWFARREPRPRRLPRPAPLRRPAGAERARDVRARRPALLPRRAPRPARADGAARGARAARRAHRARRRARAAALELHERPQAPPAPPRSG